MSSEPVATVEPRRFVDGETGEEVEVTKKSTRLTVGDMTGLTEPPRYFLPDGTEAKDLEGNGRKLKVDGRLPRTLIAWSAWVMGNR